MTAEPCLLGRVSGIWNAVIDAVEAVSPADYLALVVVISVLCQAVASRLQIPSLLLLLVTGFALGQAVDARDLFGPDVLYGGVSLAVGIILFEGSLSLRMSQIRDLGRPVLRLCLVAPAIALPLITFAAWLLGFEFEIALLIGAILIVTGPTVINPILRTLRPTRRVGSLLRWEGIVVDPIGAILAVLVFQGVRAGGLGNALPSVMATLAASVLIALVIAGMLGWLLTQMMRRHAIPDFLEGVTFLAAAIGAMSVSNAVQPESGLLTVTMLGIFMANQRDVRLFSVLEFKEHLQVLFVGSLFIVLAGQVTPGQIADIAPRALLFIAALVLIVRPISIWISLWKTRVQPREKRLLASMAPRGIVAAAVTSIFALEFTRAAGETQEMAANASGSKQRQLLSEASRLEHLGHEASEMVPLVFIVIVGTVALYGLLIGRTAKRLDLADPSPQGVLFTGASPFIVELAEILTSLRISVLIVDRNYAALSHAQMAGVTTENVNILSEYASEEMGLSGIRYLVACTEDGDTNETAARQFRPILGSRNVFQLRRDLEADAEGGNHQAVARHLEGRIAFRPATSYAEFTEKIQSGMHVKLMHLTSNFTLTDVKAYYGDRTVLLFTYRAGRLSVISGTSRIPEKDVSLIALVDEQIPL